MNALAAAGWAALASFALVIGAWVAIHLRPSRTVTGRIMGFGSGALLAAVAYELLPKGNHYNAGVFLAFFTGALVFYGVDTAVARRSSARSQAGSAGSQTGGDQAAATSIVIGALLDGIPESLVLGMGLAVGGSVSAAFLGAVFVSNLPEGLGATASMRAAGQAARDAYKVWWSLVVAAAAAAAIGYGLLRLIPHAEGHYVESFAAGAVLTMLADSMMPESFEMGGKLTGLAVALGFAAAGSLSLVG